MRLIPRQLAMFGTLAVLALALAATASAQKATSITSVEFHGSPSGAGPEIVVNGSEFGKPPAKSYPAGCGATGSVYGAIGAPGSLGLINDTGAFSAGYGNAKSASCIGLIINSWSTTHIVLHFGNNYEFYQNLNPGYNYVMQVKAAFFGGVVSYS